jgi:hypothetical protein
MGAIYRHISSVVFKIKHSKHFFGRAKKRSRLRFFKWKIKRIPYMYTNCYLNAKASKQWNIYIFVKKFLLAGKKCFSLYEIKARLEDQPDNRRTNTWNAKTRFSISATFSQNGKIFFPLSVLPIFEICEIFFGDFGTTFLVIFALFYLKYYIIDICCYTVQYF